MDIQVSLQQREKKKTNLVVMEMDKPEKTTHTHFYFNVCFTVQCLTTSILVTIIDKHIMHAFFMVFYFLPLTLMSGKYFTNTTSQLNRNIFQPW